MTDYSIRQLTESDVDAFWELRLIALQDSPDAFGSDYETSRRTGPRYAERGYFGDGPNALFAAFDSHGKMAAQAGVFGDDGKRNHIAQVVSVFTHPEHRRQGLAKTLVKAAIQHVQLFDEITSIRISVNSTNIAAKRIYEELGFVTWGEEPDAIRVADGSCHNECHMVLSSEHG